MQSPAPRQNAAKLPATYPRLVAPAPVAADPERERVARKIVAQLNEWARACPGLAEELSDCAEELAWSARLKPVEATPCHQTAGLKYNPKQIITTLLLWAELYGEHTKVLRSCAEGVQLLAQRFERRDEKRRARDIVLEALEAGHQTSRHIVDLTGLTPLRVWRALVRLQQLGLIREMGCGARTPEDGNRTRLWELTHIHNLS